MNRPNAAYNPKAVNRWASSISFGDAPAEKKTKTANPTKRMGEENLGKDLKPKTPAKVKAVRAVHGTEHPPHRTNGHMLGEEHLWSKGLVVSPTHTHEMLQQKAREEKGHKKAGLVDADEVKRLSARVFEARNQG